MAVWRAEGHRTRPWPLTSYPTGHNPCWFRRLRLPGRRIVCPWPLPRLNSIGADPHPTPPVSHLSSKELSLLILIDCIDAAPEKALCLTHHYLIGGIKVSGCVNRSQLSSSSLCCLFFVMENYECQNRWRCALRRGGVGFVLYVKPPPPKSSTHTLCLWLSLNFMTLANSDWWPASLIPADLIQSHPRVRAVTLEGSVASAGSDPVTDPLIFAWLQFCSVSPAIVLILGRINRSADQPSVNVWEHKQRVAMTPSVGGKTKYQHW